MGAVSYTTNNIINMNLFAKVPITNWEKWFTRLTAIALAVYEAVKAIINAWNN